MKKALLILPILLLTFAIVPLSGCTSKSSTLEQDPSTYIQTMPTFKSVDLNGNEVDNSIFEKSRITVVNFWGTYCSPCINEMPDLSDWAETQNPEDVQVIGVVVDVQKETESTYQDAIDICTNHGVTYTSIIANDDWREACDSLIGVPTTYFVNRKGQAIASPVIGAYVDKYKDTVEKLLNGEDTE